MSGASKQGTESIEEIARYWREIAATLRTQYDAIPPEDRDSAEARNKLAARERAERVAHSLEQNTPPYRIGQVLVVTVSGGIGLGGPRQGERVRVAAIEPKRDCGTGWWVSFTLQLHGPLRRTPRIWGSADAGCFQAAGRKAR